jgi:uncharacterized protein (TIGR02145 family)
MVFIILVLMKKYWIFPGLLLLTGIFYGCSKNDPNDPAQLTLGTKSLGKFIPTDQIAYKIPEGYAIQISSDTITFTIILTELKSGDYAVTAGELTSGKVYFNIDFKKSSYMGAEGSVSITDTTNGTISGRYSVTSAFTWPDTDGDLLKISSGKFEVREIRKIVYGSVEDYEHNTYKTIVIGSQTWMAENLRSKFYSNGDPVNGVWSYENNDNNANKYGLLYLWNSAMKNLNTEMTQGVCPTGFHLPSNAEWKVLFDNLGGELQAGGKIKSLFSWNYPNFGASNISGFSVLAAGMHYPEVEMTDHSERLGYQSFFWSSTSGETINGITLVWVIALDNIYNGISRSPYYRADQGNSVRCVKN